MRPLIVALAAAALMAGAAQAAEKPVPPEARTGIAVTLYAEGFGLVKDRREVGLEAGVNRLAFEGVSARMVPSSAILRAGDGLRVIEQNFEFDLISPEALLERSVGQTVRVVRVHPTTGENIVEKATVLAAEKGVVLRIGDRIETGMPGRLVFDGVPPGLRAQPTLVLDVETPAAGPREVALTYLTEGLNWRAEYAVELDPEGERLDLSAWASLSNSTDSAFENAEVQLVAGDVNRERSYALKAAPMGRAMMEEAVPASAMEREAVGDLHVYSLPGTVTLKNRQTKQVAMMSAAGVKAARDYVHERWIPERSPRVTPVTPIVERPVTYLRFENAADNGLGQPLPAGLIRVYQRDSKGRLLFAGEQSVEHKAADETVVLDLGEAVDIGIQYEQTDFTKDGLPKKAFESAQSIRLANAKDKDVVVRLVEHFPGAAKILNESRKHVAFSGGAAAWEVPVPAGGEARLEYRVRVQRPD